MFIRAPFDGTVISKDAEVGESILPGGMGDASGRGSVVTIADLGHFMWCDPRSGNAVPWPTTGKEVLMCFQAAHPP